MTVITACPQLIALDIDGTLLNSRHEPLPSTIEAVAAARGRGTVVALVSGRDPHMLRILAERIGLELEGLVLIGRNGSIVMDAVTGETLWSAAFPADLLGRLVEHLSAFPQVAASAPAGPRLYSAQPDGHYVRIEAGHNEQELHVVPSLAHVPEPLTKVLMSAPAETIQALAGQIAAPFHDELTFAFSAPFYYEATLAGVDKGTALLRLCQEAGLDPAATVAFGDQENDLGMLRAAGLGVAMGNAIDSVKEAADVITDDHDSDGIANLLRDRFAL